MTGRDVTRTRQELALAVMAQLLLLGGLTVVAGLTLVGWVVGLAFAVAVGLLLDRAARVRGSDAPGGTGLCWTGPGRTGPGRTGPGWTGLGWTGPGRRGVDWRGLGPANLVTLIRGVLIGGVTALVADELITDVISVPALVAIGSVALALDAVDGKVARRTGSVSALGARFDMELDAFLVLVLSVLVAPTVGAWVLAIGSMRYAFYVAGAALPWLRGDLPTRYSAKVVAATQGVVLLLAASGLVPTATAGALLAVALGLLIWSFGHDIRWLWLQWRAALRPFDELRAGRFQRAPGTRVRPDSRGLSLSRGGSLVTALAAMVLLGGLLLPAVAALPPGSSARAAVLTGLPIEPVLAAAVLLLVAPRVGRIVATGAGIGLGLVSVLAVLDLGFRSVLSRPFDPTSDWALADSVVHLLTGTMGRHGAIAAVVAALGGAVVLLVAVTWAAGRLFAALDRRRAAVTTLVAVLVPVCAIPVAVRAELVPGVRLAAAPAAALALTEARDLGAVPGDQRTFLAANASDAFREVPAAELLSGLRGKDVVVAFVESYGRDVLTEPDYAAAMAATLADGDRRLGRAGFASRSAYLTSPVSGGGSWLAHSTFHTGVWVDRERHYATLLEGNRLSLPAAFRRAGWRTVAIVPGVTRDWPEGRFYGFEQIWDTRNLGYRGPDLGWASTPDQYSLAAFQAAEYGRPDRSPLFAEIEFVSSHAPWPLIPPVLAWDQIGDGAVYHGLASNRPREAIWDEGTAEVRSAYRRSLTYTWQSLISWLETYGDDDLVLVVLGDHQPAPLLAGPGAGRDVPVSIITRDPAVLSRTADWAWPTGLAPPPGAPVWRMDAFRDRFLTAFA